jgi:ubiquinone/menaquinone biosynthesis C-methylase UbiE
VVAPVWRETCSYCGDVSTTPEEIKAGTAGGFGRAASTYDTVIPFFETFARYLVEVAAPNPGDRVMDVACGRGACLRVAAEDVGSSGYVLGVDLSRAMIDIAGEDLARLKLAASVEVRVGDAEHLDLPDDCFDVVVCGFGVFFFPDPGAALSEVRRVLRDGGRFAGSTFVGSGGGYPWIGEVLHAIRPTAVMPPRSPVATAAGLTEFLQRAGFVDTRHARWKRVSSFRTWMPISPGTGPPVSGGSWSPSTTKKPTPTATNQPCGSKTTPSQVVTNSSKPRR